MFRSCLIYLSLFIFPGIVVAEQMTFRWAGSGGNCQGCEWIAAEGEITLDTPNRFREFMSDVDYRALIVFNSPGGNLVGGVELGKLIREYDLDTSIGDTVPSDWDPSKEETTFGICASACAFAYIGGVERQVGEGLLGVHQFYGETDVASNKATQALVGILMLHIMEMGVDPNLLVIANLTDPSDMAWLSIDDMNDLRVSTASSNYIEEWRLEPYKTGLVLTSRYYQNKRQSLQVTLFCRRNSSRWHVLVTEFRDLTEYRDALLSNYKTATNLKLGNIDLTNDDIRLESIRVNNGRTYLSISLPVDLTRFAQQEFTHITILGSSWIFFMIEGALPESNWLNVLKHNCI